MGLAQSITGGQRPTVGEAAGVLAKLEEWGLREPLIASGYVRSLIAGTPPGDIDVSYVGDVPHERAREYLVDALDELKLDKAPWDVEGIWNIQQQYPQITTTVQNIKFLYVCSIDSVYLASDGQFHDLMGTGMDDAKKKVLRMNDFESFDFAYPPMEKVYLCIEGCRRMVRFGWQPTMRSVELIRRNTDLWDKLSGEEQRVLVRKRIRGKYRQDEYSAAQQVYDLLGWGFVFDEARSGWH